MEISKRKGMLEGWVSETWNPRKSQTPNMPRIILRRFDT
jgi:hypothetical protein